jgi:hypothetical protein
MREWESDDWMAYGFFSGATPPTGSSRGSGRLKKKQMKKQILSLKCARIARRFNHGLH